MGTTEIEDNQRTVGQKHPNSTNPRAYHLPLQKRKTGTTKGAEVAVPSNTTASGPKFVDEQGALRAKMLRVKVETTESYRQRVQQHLERGPFEGGLGVIMALHKCGDGHVCDVVWDNGKLLQGYCIGYRGQYDLQFADTTRPTFSVPNTESISLSRSSIQLSRSYQYEKQESFCKTPRSPVDESRKLGKLSESTSCSSLEEQDADAADIKVKICIISWLRCFLHARPTARKQPAWMHRAPATSDSALLCAGEPTFFDLYRQSIDCP
jgi:hypothetical protein